MALERFTAIVPNTKAQYERSHNANGTVTNKGINVETSRRKKSDLKSNKRLKTAIWILEKACMGIEMPATINTLPKPGLPTKTANESANNAIPPKKETHGNV